MWALRVCGALLVAALLVAPATSARAQDDQVVRSPVLAIDPDALFTRSQFGQAFEEQLIEDSRALEAENRRIEGELAAEEQALTEKRPQMSPEEFRDLADAFDTKVQRIRNEQQAKARKLSERGDAARRKFLNAAGPILQRIMQEAGAAVIVDKRTIFMSADIIDVTGLAVERVNEAIGRGKDLGGSGAGDAPDAPEGPGADESPSVPDTDGSVRLPPASDTQRAAPPEKP
ncbi:MULTISPECIES: OmpH family outer membrane protein [Sediminimonas]|uniref:OmpH family outer membrane protein n=1 Tax=Sediminimonas TaxID=659427 RepID=UPI000429B431|nr:MULTISPECIES: OmpH family outer membrane protein [Sediminimonas]MDR9484461.1 OmpH family outer membrane protein [Sediminimonas sp.]